MGLVSYLCVLFLCLCPSLYGEWDCDACAGYQFAWGMEQNGITRNQPFIEVCGTYSPPSDDAIDSYRASARTTYEATTGYLTTEMRSLLYNRTSDALCVKIGLQEVPWGETFGFFPADMVNPRELTDPLFNELCWIRIPVACVNFQHFYDAWSFQYIVTPFARNNLFPKEGSPFDVVPQELQGLPLLGPPPMGHDAEYGCKIGYLFPNGLDVSLLYFRHFNRNVVYQFVPFGPFFALQPVVRKINTVGFTFSHVYGDYVFRGDTVLHFNTPLDIRVFGFPKNTNYLESILGLDRILMDGWWVGGQYHLNWWEGGSLHHISGLVTKSFYNGTWCLECFLYQGIGNFDRWLQPKVTWNGPNGWCVNLRGDFIWGTTHNENITDGFLGPFKKKDRFFLWITRRF